MIVKVQLALEPSNAPTLVYAEGGTPFFISRDHDASKRLRARGLAKGYFKVEMIGAEDFKVLHPVPFQGW